MLSHRLRLASVLCALAVTAPRAHAQATQTAQQDSAKLAAQAKLVAQQNQQKLLKALRDTHVTVVAGLTTAEAKGKPLSAKFIYIDALYLSVFVEKGGTYYEALVGGKSGTVRRTTKLADTTALNLAAQQDSVLAKATVSLADAIGKLALVPANKGWDPVSIAPVFRSDAPVAEIMIRKGPMGRPVRVPLN
jgi:hypothetical protein